MKAVYIEYNDEDFNVVMHRDEGEDTRVFVNVFEGGFEDYQFESECLADAKAEFKKIVNAHIYEEHFSEMFGS